MIRLKPNCQHALVLFTCFFVLSSQTCFAKTYDTERWITPNGTHVVFYHTKEVPMLDISLAFAAGSAYDGSHYGLSTLTTQLLNQGNQGLTATQLAEKLEQTGAQYNAESSRDMVAISLRTLTRPDALTQSIDAFSLIINHPDFPEESFERAKNQQLMSVKQAQESPDEVANQVFYQTLYQDHPYAHPVIGDTQRVMQLTRDQVRNFYRQYFVGKNAVLVLVGAIDNQTAHQLATKITQDLPTGQRSPSIPMANAVKQANRLNVSFPSSQTVLRIGQLGITHHDPQYFAFLVGNYILGGGSLVSELGIALREKRGLTYGVSSQFAPMPGVGPFVISFSTRHQKASEAEKITRDTLSHFVSHGPTETQLHDAKRYLTGGFPLSLASNRSITDILLKIAFYHLPDDYLNNYIQRINAVTTADIKQAFQAKINPARLLQINVGRQ